MRLRKPIKTNSKQFDT